MEMNKEIKEILENMKKWSVDGNLYFEINDEKAKLLYDYITNLQEENNRLNNQYDLMENSLDEKQEVIDKSIEYLNTNSLLNFEHNEEQNIDLITDTKAKEDLLNILQNK
jgi:hypothetical protein